MKRIVWTLLLGAAACASTRDVIPTPVVLAPEIVALTVTDAGFEPDEVAVKKGQPVRLVITRKTDATCARDIVVPAHGIHRALPLGEAVEVTFTPAKTGEIRFGCAMGQMVGGVLLVE